MNPKTRQDNVVIQELGQEILIYDLNDNKAFCLNETSAMIWQLCDGNRTVSQIAESVGRKLNQPANAEIVWLALDQLKKENLVSVSEDDFKNSSDVSRREMIKKAGLTSMIALPVVSSLVAPKAINASSHLCDSTSAACTAPTGRPNDCCCQNGPQCQSGNCVGIGGGLKACRP